MSKYNYIYNPLYFLTNKTLTLGQKDYKKIVVMYDGVNMIDK